MKNDRGLDISDLPLLVKLYKMKIFFYAVWPRDDGKNQFFQGKANRLIISTINKLKAKDNDTLKVFKDFKDKEEIINILKIIVGKLGEIVFSANILGKSSKGRIQLLEQIKKDLFKIYNIHDKFIKIIESLNTKTEKFKISISGEILEKDDNNYIKILDDSPFFFEFSIDDIKRKEAERLLDDCDVSRAWLFFYNKRVESLRKEILEKIKNIYSDVKIDTEIDETIFSDKESWFYRTEKTKDFILKLIDFFAGKYKQLELSKKYYSACKEYNKSIKEFEKYVEEFKNLKLNEESVRYDIDFI